MGSVVQIENLSAATNHYENVAKTELETANIDRRVKENTIRGASIAFEKANEDSQRLRIDEHQFAERWKLCVDSRDSQIAESTEFLLFEKAEVDRLEALSLGPSPETTKTLADYTWSLFCLSDIEVWT